MPSQDPQGFSLLELLLVMTLLGILTGIASLQLAPLLQRVAVNSGVRQVATDLQLVRMQAVAHNRRLRVTFQPGSDTYLVEKERTDAGRTIASTVMTAMAMDRAVSSCQRV